MKFQKKEPKGIPTETPVNAKPAEKWERLEIYGYLVKARQNIWENGIRHVAGDVFEVSVDRGLSLIRSMSAEKIEALTKKVDEDGDNGGE